MIRRIAILAACTVAIAFAPAGQAQEVESRAIERKHLDSGKAKLDPSKAYIYITGPARTAGVFIKTADAQDISLYEAEWKEEFADEQRKYARKLKTWERVAKSGRNAGSKPIEPTPQNFSIGPLEQRLIVSFGPQYIYDKGKNASGERWFSYLIETEPGNYTYLGPVSYAPGNPVAGVCYCMGSVQFDVPAGQVTSLGDFLAFRWVDADAARQASVAPAVEQLAAEVVPVDYSVPPELAEFGAAPADLRAAGKTDNFLGVMIGRMPPIEGVLAYDRDTPIDLKGLAAKNAVEAAAAAPTAEAQIEMAVEDAERQP